MNDNAPETTDTTSDTRYERGLAVLRQVAGTDRPAVLDSLADIAPDLARYTVEFGYGDIYSRSGLTLRQRQLVNVAALAALGRAEPQLRFHLAGALNVGCTRREIVETLIHVCLYAGFPAALSGLGAAREVFETHPAAGEPTPAEPPAPGETTDDRYRRGLAALSEIDGHAGEQVIASLRDIAPDLGRYLLEFAFGDVYARTGLDLHSRELATVAMCTALGTAAPQLAVHIHALLNVGGTEEEVVETITQMAGYAGFPAALNGVAVARTVFAERAAHPDRSWGVSEGVAVGLSEGVTVGLSEGVAVGLSEGVTVGVAAGVAEDASAASSRGSTYGSRPGPRPHAIGAKRR